MDTYSGDTHMNSIPFVKYTSFGNTFVIVDETQQGLLSERQKSAFAYQATSVDFGIGCDNLLVIQQCNRQVLEAINDDRKYFDDLPDVDGIHFVFRMFEPDGQEAYSCGNGLMSIASYLQRRYGISSARILTELPTGFPRRVTIGTDAGTGSSWADMGIPGSIPEEMAHPNAYLKSHGGLDRLRALEIRFRANDLMTFTNRDSMTLWGFLVYTGEPHLVIFPDSGFSIQELADVPFLSPGADSEFGLKVEKRYNFGIWLVKQVGNYLNSHYRGIFPKGINVDFARVIKGESQILEYRCFERGINRETLACGTGALAVSYVARKLAVTRDRQITLWPSRCRWYEHDAEIQINEGDTGWRLIGRPRELLAGAFSFDSPGVSDAPKFNANLNGSMDWSKNASNSESASAVIG